MSSKKSIPKTNLGGPEKKEEGVFEMKTEVKRKIKSARDSLGAEIEEKQDKNVRKQKTISTNVVYSRYEDEVISGKKVLKYRAGEEIVVRDTEANTEDVYGKDGRQIFHREMSSGSSVENVIFDVQGNPLQDFKTEKLVNPRITPETYLERVKKIAPDKEKFFRYERLFLSRYYSQEGPEAEKRFPPKLLRDIRKHGEQLAKIPQLKTKIEEQFGIRIIVRLSNEEVGEYITAHSSVNHLRTQLESLEKALGVLSPTIIQNIKLRNIYLLSVFQKKKDGYLSRAGGIYDIMQTKEIILLNGGVGTIFHEIGHAIDDADGGMGNENPLWIRSARTHGGKNAADYVHEGYINIKKNILIDYPSRYAKKNVNEDFAEIVQLLLDRTKILLYPTESINERIKTEPGLAKKIQMAKDILYRMSDGWMDEQYWEDLESRVEINPEYWKKREDRGDFKPSQKRQDRMVKAVVRTGDYRGRFF